MAMAPHSRTLGKSHGWRSLVGCSSWGHEESDTTERLPFHFSLSCPGEGLATHSSVLAWRIPGMEETGGLPSMGSHRVGHDWIDLAAATAAPSTRAGHTPPQFYFEGGALVWFLAGELSSHMPCGLAKKFKNKTLKLILVKWEELEQWTIYITF